MNPHGRSGDQTHGAKYGTSREPFDVETNMSRRNSLRAQLRALEAAAAIGAAVAFCAPALADDIKVPTDPVAKAAFDALERHCARCHQEGKLQARERPAKNFGNVLQLDELAESPGRILPGNPFASKMFKQVIDKEMPYDVIYEGAAGPLMTEQDVKAIETWIVSLGSAKGRAVAVEAAPPAPEAAPPPSRPAPAPRAEAPPAAEPEPPPAEPPQQTAVAPEPAPAPAPEARPAPGRPPAVAVAAPAPAEPACKFVNHKDMIGIIAADLDAMPKSRAKGTRYLTLTHLASICTKEKFMEVYRQAAIKLVNSLSRSSDVVVLEGIDPARSILRINIDDLGWDAADWEALVAEYPYGTRPDTQLNNVLASATGTKTAYVRGDWFAFKASRPVGIGGMYEKLLKLPKTAQELAKQQGVDISNNIKRFTAQRAGFQKSGVSAHNRLIERHPSKNGYFWTSYDFAGSRRKQSLFEFPLGPGGATGFDHDGGETIFSLPNGFQAYYLNTADGKQLDKGPVDIVRDLDNPRDPSVINGISCMRCHDQGMRKAKDDIRESVSKGRSFSKEVREQVEALFPPSEKMDQIIAGDAKRFADAMTRAGLNPSLKLNGVEMTFALSRAYEEDLGLEQAASELGLQKDEFLQAAQDADKQYKSLVRRLQQGTIPRDDFEAKFIELAKEIGDEEPIKAAAAPAAGRPAPAAPKGGGKPVAAKAGELVLTSDRDTYKVGDTPVFTVVAPTDCFLTLTNVDEKGEGTVLFPNKFQQNNKIKGKVELQFPNEKSFVYRMKDPGIETVIAVCTDKGGEVDGIKHNFTRSVLTSVPDYSASVAKSVAAEPVKRAIVVEGGDLAAKPAAAPAKPGAKPAPGPAPKAEAPKADAPPVSLRNAIKIQVQ
jgi:hypothetical protein